MSARAEQLAKNLQRFRLITFDVTDTLLSFRQAPAIQYAKTAAKHGITNTDQHQMQQCFRKEFKFMAKEYPNFGCRQHHMSWQDWWIQLVERIFHCQNNKIPDTKLRAIAEELLEIYRTNKVWVHTEGSVELLKSLQNIVDNLGVISNFDPSLSKVLREMEIDKYFNFVLTSYEAGVQKPDKQIFNQALENCKVMPQQALHIGNIYEIDFLGATKAGWSSILLQTELDENNVIKHRYANLTELKEALETCDIEW